MLNSCHSLFYLPVKNVILSPPFLHDYYIFDIIHGLRKATLNTQV